MNERLYRSRDDRIIAGVAGGVAERFGIDPSLIRIVWVILIFATAGAALVLYVIMAFVVPEEPAGDSRWAAWERQTGGYQWPDPATSGTGAPGAGGTTPASSSISTSAAAAGSGAAAGLAGASDAPGSSGPVGSSGAAAGSGPATPSPAWIAPPASPTPGMTPPGSAAPPNPPWPTDRRAARDAARDARRAARAERRDGSGAVFFGLILIVVGGYFFARAYLPDIDANRVWPIILVVLGALLLVGSFRRGSNSPH